MRAPVQWLEGLRAHEQARRASTADAGGVQHMLHLDLSCIGGFASLPRDVIQMHGRCLIGPFFVQLQELWDVSLNDEQRRDRSNTPAEELTAEGKHRMLKLSLTDGLQELVGFEYQRIPELNARTQRGTKLLLHNVTVRRGMLVLTPACVTVIGGSAPGDGVDGQTSGSNVDAATAAAHGHTAEPARPAAGGEGAPPAVQSAQQFGQCGHACGSGTSGGCAPMGGRPDIAAGGSTSSCAGSTPQGRQEHNPTDEEASCPSVPRCTPSYRSDELPRSLPPAHPQPPHRFTPPPPSSQGMTSLPSQRSQASQPSGDAPSTPVDLTSSPPQRALADGSPGSQCQRPADAAAPSTGDSLSAASGAPLPIERDAADRSSPSNGPLARVGRLQTSLREVVQLFEANEHSWEERVLVEATCSRVLLLSADNNGEYE
ncbi:hypothetical protein AB1Y20_023152 [Prymnesium parvum]|uniref:RecQ-mediated genome instability protein 1 n=1 Tax=Prymnesium parvum TaxID=97485 RepID=A0AB34JDK0_PRYPA